MNAAEKHYEDTRQKAMAGDLWAYARLSILLYQGNGVNRDPVAARAWARDCAMSLPELGAYIFALYCDFGQGGSMEGTSAIDYYKHAAKKGGVPEAAWSLSWLYLKQRHTTRNYAEALYWNRVARDRLGLTNAGKQNIADYQADICRRHMTKAEIDEVVAKVAEFKAG